jgi:hypothetical protein
MSSSIPNPATNYHEFLQIYPKIFNRSLPRHGATTTGANEGEKRSRRRALKQRFGG